MGKMVTVNHEDPLVRTFILFMQLAGTMTKYVDRHLYQDHDLSTTKFIALQVLVFNGGKMTHSQLATWTNTEKHNITALVDRMKKEQLVTAKRSRKDRRIVEIRITEKGQELLKRATPLGQSIIQQVMRGIDERHIHDFERLLRTIQENIEQD